MFLSHWFEVSGLDQVMAPDPDAEENARTKSSRDDMMEVSPLWDIVAPRPPPPEGGAESAPQASDAVAPAGRAVSSSDGKLVRCRHCGNMTPVVVDEGLSNGDEGAIRTRRPRSHPTTPAANDFPETPHNTPSFDTPPSSASVVNSNAMSMTRGAAIVDPAEAAAEGERALLHAAVLRAARETALTSSGPTFAWEAKHALFSLCAAAPKPPKKGKDGKPIPPKVGKDGKPVLSKNLKKLSKMLGSKPHLVESRSANMTSLGLPDGFTVLHAACHAGNCEVVGYLLKHHVLAGAEEGEEGGGAGCLLDLNERDVQGRTALHIAADRGHIDVIEALRKAYGTLEERAKKLLEDDSSDSDDGSEEEEEQLAAEMAKLSTSENAQSKAEASPKTPKSRSPMRRRAKSSRSPKPPSNSPKPPSSRSPMRSPKRSPTKSPIRSPAFSGCGAPVDLSGKTPLGYAATSPAPNAKKNRGDLEKILYSPGDRSIVGVGGAERTPPKARCGPRGRFLSPGKGVSGGRKVAFDRSSPSPLAGADSYLSPTPQKHQARFSTPGSATSSKFGTPFSSLQSPPPPTIPEEEACSDGIRKPGEGGDGDNPLGLLWGAAEMNGWRIDMEDKILVKSELYGEREAVPPRPPPRSGPLGKGTGPVDAFLADPKTQGVLRVQLFDDLPTLEFVLDVQGREGSWRFVGNTRDGKWHINLVPGRGKEGTFHASVTCDETGNMYSISPDANGDMKVTMRRQQDYPGCGVCDGPSSPTTTVPTMALFGVFDGHGDGGHASDFIATNLELKMKAQPDWALAYHGCNDASRHELLKSVLEAAYRDLDEDLRNDATKPRDGGTTAIVALVSVSYLIVANVGDSRCILVRKRKADDDISDGAKLEVVPMSEDHKPDLPEERARIESAGLSVQADRVPSDGGDPDSEATVVHRVRKSDRELLGVSRAFGDYDYKSNKELSPSRQAVVSAPDVAIRERADGEDMYLVLACDGVWDVMSNDEAGSFLARRVAESLGRVGGVAGGVGGAAASPNGGTDGASDERAADSVRGEVLARVGDDLLEECLRRGSRDNMSALIVALPASRLPLGNGGRVGSSTSSQSAALAKEEEVPGPAMAADGTVRTLAFE